MGNRYLLQKSTTKAGWWTLTDKEAGLVCLFEEHKFNETQQFTFLDNDPQVLMKYGPSAIARVANEMVEWLAANNYKILMSE